MKMARKSRTPRPIPTATEAMFMYVKISRAVVVDDAEALPPSEEKDLRTNITEDCITGCCLDITPQFRLELKGPLQCFRADGLHIGPALVGTRPPRSRAAHREKADGQST